MTTRYVYQPLSRERMEIRLLKINGIISGTDYGYEGQCISGTLEKATLDGPYMALSYVWGDPEFSSAIITPEGLIPITQNLLTAICDVHWHEKSLSTVPIWIDAICINQSDDEEKGLQVRSMGRIYEHADKTLIFLGSTGEESSFSSNDFSNDDFQNLSDIGKRAISFGIYADPREYGARVKRLVGNLDWWQARATEDDKEFSDFIRSHIVVDPEDSQWVSFYVLLSSILKMRWWSRVWVLQELCMSKNPTIIWGRAKMSPKHLIASLLFVRELRELRFEFPSKYRDRSVHKALEYYENLEATPASLFAYREWATSSTGSWKPTFVDLFGHIAPDIHTMGATDPRDVIYSLYGMLDPDSASTIAPDYSISLRALFIETTWVLLQGGWFYMLRVALKSTRSPELPTWVPNWSSLTKGHYLGILRALSRPPGTRLGTVEGGNHMLVLKGHLYSSINETISPNPEPNTVTEYGFAMYWADDANLILDYTLRCRDMLVRNFSDPIIRKDQIQMLAKAICINFGSSQALTESGQRFEYLFEYPRGLQALADRFAEFISSPNIDVLQSITSLSHEDKEGIWRMKTGSLQRKQDLDSAFVDKEELLQIFCLLEQSFYEWTPFVADKYVGLARGRVQSGQNIARMEMDPTMVFVVQYMRTVQDHSFELVTTANVPQVLEEAVPQQGVPGDILLR